MPANGFVNVRTDFSAVGDGVADDTLALRSAIAQAIRQGGATVYIPAGTYRITTGIEVSGNFNLLGDGEASVIHSTDKTRSVLKIRGAEGARYTNFSISQTALNYSDRDAAANGLYLTDSRRCLVSGLTVSNTYAAGLFLVTCEDCKVTSNHVRNTLADGIHLTNRSIGCMVTGNTVSDTGDDGIAVVSYRRDGGYCERIVITGNMVVNSWSRGIAHVGGKRVTIADNMIVRSAGSGVFVAEDTNFATYKAYDTVIHHNQIDKVGQFSPPRPLTANKIGIEATAGAKGLHVEGNQMNEPLQAGISVITSAPVTGAGVYIAGNRVYRASSNGAFLLGPGPYTFSGNTLEECTQYGLYALRVSFGLFTNNRFLNNNYYDRDNPGTGSPDANTQAIDNANFSQCSDCIITNNSSVDDRTDRARARIERAMEIGGGERVKAGGNACYVYNSEPSKLQRQESFIAGARSAERMDTYSGTAVPDASIYKAGQLYFRTDTKELYIYDGAAWRLVNLK